MTLYLKKSLLVLCILGFCGISMAQIYVSPKQKTTIGGHVNRLETEVPKRVTIDGDNFTLELPEGGTLSGTMQFSKKIEREEELRMMYNIDGGGILSVIDDLVDDNYDHIYVNLLVTPKNKTYTYWLNAGNKGDD